MDEEQQVMEMMTAGGAAADGGVLFAGASATPALADNDAALQASMQVSASINPLCTFNDYTTKQSDGIISASPDGSGRGSVHVNGLFHSADHGVNGSTGDAMMTQDGRSKAFSNVHDSDADLGDLEAYSAASKFTDLSPRQHRMRKFVDSILFQSLLVCLILLDVALLIADVVVEDMGIIVSMYSIILVSILAIELVMRVYAFGKYFTSDPLNIIDSVVVFVSVVVLAFFDSKAASIVNLGRIARVARTVWNSAFILVKGFSTKEHAARAARLKVSGNKNRFFDPTNGFDLDLSYITTSLIAMSVPSTGGTALYRNPLPEVKRFFTTRHKSRTRIYNLCPELPYPDAEFDYNVVKFNVRDHTPPSIADLIRLVCDIEEWLAADAENVAAVHCRGGKGRTGSAVVAYLLYSRLVHSVDEGLLLFASRRTNARKKGKLQGVDTPSQVRYMQYFHALLLSQDCYAGGREMKILRSPPPMAVRLSHIESDRLFPVRMPKSQEMRLHAEVHAESCGRVVCQSVTVQNNSWVLPLEQVTVSGDVRIAVFDTDKSSREGAQAGMQMQQMQPGSQCAVPDACKAGTEPGVLFYFVLHTSFLLHDLDATASTGASARKMTLSGGAPGAEGSTTLALHEIDKACKNKNKQYNKRGSIRCVYEWL